MAMDHLTVKGMLLADLAVDLSPRGLDMAALIDEANRSGRTIVTYPIGSVELTCDDGTRVRYRSATEAWEIVA